MQSKDTLTRIIVRCFSLDYTEERIIYIKSVDLQRYRYHQGDQRYEKRFASVTANAAISLPDRNKSFKKV